jgi:bacillithiol synthase
VRSECLPFTKIPHTTRLFTDFLYDPGRVKSFYSHPPHVSDWLKDESTRVRYDGERRAAVAAILERQNRQFGASAKVFDSIQRFRRGAVAAVTGQQVGFLGGPLFSILKALSAVRLAEQANELGMDCVPVFWLATDDHDFEEIRSAVVQDSNGGLHTLSLDNEHLPGAPMRDVRLDEGVTPIVNNVAGLVGNPEVAGILRQAYRPGETVGSAFARLFTILFAEYGVIMLDASDPELHRIAAPVYAQAISNAQELNAALLARGKELQGAGYHEQVKVTPSSTLLFGMADGARVPIHRSNGTFIVKDERLSADELAARVAANPDRFSANVLLRPIVQDFLLPTIAYVGGPAEIAYFAQAAVVYERILGRRTPVLPRFSATLVDARATRILQQYGMDITDLFHGPEHVSQLIASRSLPADLQTAFEDGTQLLERAIEGLTEPLRKLDPTLLGSATRAGNKMRHSLERLRKRAAAAELRRSEIIARHAAHLNASLFPHKDLQERVIAGISFAARYGESLLPVLYDAAQKDCLDHQVIFM